MVSGSITNVSIQMSSGMKDMGRKKRTNRSARLKQCKLDARREQWLSQVKNKGYKVELINEETPLASHSGNNGNKNPDLGSNNGPFSSERDLGSPSNSPTSCSSLLSSKESGTRTSSSSSCSVGSYSRSISDEEGSDGCLDDWEAVADALAVNDELNNSNPREELKHHQDTSREHSYTTIVSRFKSEESTHETRSVSICRQAWRSDDAYRPQSLPNLGKQLSFTIHGSRDIVSPPSHCPICYEELDNTDSSFLPCSCGFRLCLFCHKRILEEDGRCPGCRNPYLNDHFEAEASLDDGTLTVRLGRSASVVTGS